MIRTLFSNQILKAESGIELNANQAVSIELINTIKQYFQEKLQIIEAVIYKMDGASVPFRKKLVGMARRAVRILQRSCRDLFPR